MKKVTDEQIALLQKRSEQSRRGEPVSPAEPISRSRSGITQEELILTVGKSNAKNKTNTATLTLNGGAGPLLLHVRVRRRRLA